MKKLYKLIFIILVLFVVTSCNNKSHYELSINDNVSTEIYLGDELDFKSFFTIKDKKGKVVEIEDSMIDATNVDLNKEGTYKVKLIYNGFEKEVEITVIEKKSVIYSITVNTDISTNISIGNDNFDFKQFFTITDSNANST